MYCVILAAGYATRLYPLTRDFPKPLLEVGGKTILDWLIDDVSAAGVVEEFAVVTNHRFAAHFEEWAARRQTPARAGQRIAVVNDGTETNETRLGAVRDIAFAVQKRGYRDDLLVLAGDNVLDFSLAAFLRYAESKKNSCIMRYYEPDRSKLVKRGVAEIGADDRVLSMQEKPAAPKSNWCVPPFYYYTAADVQKINAGIAAGCGTDAPGSFIAWLSAVSPVFAMEMPGKRYDIGTIENYEQVKREYRGIGEKK